MPKLGFLITAIAAFTIGWVAGRLIAHAPMTPSPVPTPEAATPVIDLSACWHPGMVRNASIAIEIGC
jgi:hypothetical protein